MQSPFEREISDPFAPDFVDLESLNAAASDAIKERIDDVRKRASSPDLRSHSVTVLGPAGAGKTHLFARLRKACGARASFVLQRPEVGVESSLQHVLASIVEGLKRPPPGHDDSLLESVVGSFLASVRGQSTMFPRALLADLRARGDAACEEAIESALETAERRFPEIDAEWLEQLLRVPFAKPAVRRAAIVWLAGREPSELDLERLGRSERLAASAVLPALRTLGVVAAVGAPIVVVFDQLENLASEDDAPVHAHARVVADLFDGVRGLVLVQMALDAEWERRIRPKLSQAERARLEAEVRLIGLPNAEQRDELLRLWLDVLPEGERPKPFPRPFTDEQWAELRTRPAMTPRALIVAARRAMAGELPVPDATSTASAETVADDAASLDDRLEELWSQYLTRAREEHDLLAKESRGIESERLVGALVAVASLQEGRRAEPVAARQKHDVRIVEATRRVAVVLAQAVHPRSVAASLQNAANLAQDRDVLVVRQSSLGVPPTWKKVREHFAELRRAPRVEVLELTRDEICELLAAHDFLAAARSQDLTGPNGMPIPEAAVRSWLVEHVNPGRTRILRAREGGERREGRDDADEPQTALPFVSRKSSPGAVAAPRVAESPASAGSRSPAPTAEEGPAMRALRRLRLASIDRITREAASEGATRASVLEELTRHPQVRRFGRSIVWLEGAEGAAS